METVSVDTILRTGGSKSNDCKKNLEVSDKQKKRSGKKKKPRKQENELKNNDSYITSQNGNADRATSSKERKEGETEKSTSEVQVQLSKNCSSTLPSESCQRLSISCQEPGAKPHHNDPSFPSREDSPDATRNGASKKISRRRAKKKKKDSSFEVKMLEDAEKTTHEDQVHPPKNSLSNSIIQEGPHKHTQDSCEKPSSDLLTLEGSRPDATNMTCSQRKKKKKESDRNTLKESGVDIHRTNAEVAAKYNIVSEAEGSKSKSIEEKTGTTVVINSCLKSKDDKVEQREGTYFKLSETVSQTQSPKPRKKKKGRTKTVEVCDPLGNTLGTSMRSGPVECKESNDGNAVRELMSNLASKRENSASGKENGSQHLGETEEKKTDENTGFKEDVLGAGECDVMRNKRKGKKKKMSSADHKVADMVVCDPSRNSLLATVGSRSVECLLDHSNREEFVESCYGNARQEFVDDGTTSETEKSAMNEKSGVQNPGKRKKKGEDQNVESNQDALGGEDVSDVGRKRQKNKRKKNKNCESIGNTDCESVQCLFYHSNREGEENYDGTADGGTASKDLTSKLEDSATEGKSVQNVEISKKSKKDKKGKVDQDSLGAEGVSKVELKTTEEKSIQNGKHTKKKKKDRKVDQDALEAEASKVEGESVQNDENTKERKQKLKGEGVQDSLGAGVNNVEVKTKKKSSLDHKTDSMEENDDVSLPRNDEELEFNRETLETSLSRTVLIHNNVAQGVVPPETGDVPRCSCEGQSTKKLIVFDLNGILADIVQGFTGQFVPDGKVSNRSVFLRPFVHSFLDFCFERFDIGIWSSRRIGLDYMTNLVMGNRARNLLFCFGQNICTTTRFKTLENSTKPLFLKDLRRVWERFGTCVTCGKRKYVETNTLLVDDSPDKSLCNPPNTGVFPHTYQYTDREDSALGEPLHPQIPNSKQAERVNVESYWSSTFSLQSNARKDTNQHTNVSFLETGPEGELRRYLERLADATNVQKFVAENPFGQTAITETHESWEFYSKVVEAYSRSPTRISTM